MNGVRAERGGKRWGGFVRGAETQKSGRWRRQSVERFIDRKREQEICGVGDRQKDKGQAASVPNKDRLTGTDRQRPGGKMGKVRIGDVH